MREDSGRFVTKGPWYNRFRFTPDVVWVLLDRLILAPLGWILVVHDYARFIGHSVLIVTLPVDMLRYPPRAQPLTPRSLLQ